MELDGSNDADNTHSTGSSANTMAITPPRGATDTRVQETLRILRTSSAPVKRKFIQLSVATIKKIRMVTAEASP